jgi:hypothetical protein
MLRTIQELLDAINRNTSKNSFAPICMEDERALANEIEQLRAEVEWLKAALKRIAYTCGGPVERSRGSGEFRCVVRIAREALGES